MGRQGSAGSDSLGRGTRHIHHPSRTASVILQVLALQLRHATRLLTGLLFRRKSRRLFDRHTRMKGMLQIIVLPFEDKYILETERLERCPNAFVFVDPETDQVNTVPTCAWSLHKNAVLRAIAERYNTASPAGAEAPD